MVQGMGLGDNNPKEKKNEKGTKRVPKKESYEKAKPNVRKDIRPKQTGSSDLWNKKSIPKSRFKDKKSKQKFLVAIPLLVIFLIILFIGLNYQNIIKDGTGEDTIQLEDPERTDENTEYGVDTTDKAEVYASDSELLALESAGIHITHNPYSLVGLRKQLQQEGYSPNAVDYAITEIDTKSGVDWNANAVESAERFIAYAMPEVSEKLLKEQLLYEGFTGDEIKHALSNVNKSGFKADDEIPETYLPEQSLDENGENPIEEPEVQDEVVEDEN